ncbi:Integral membrane protein [Lasiodiplodia theobromae]|uniref:Integral membrane protein n=1 Tax=Lasiodiplodia theobromae TaxID=45133 RepID=UPI0015C39DAF|nr:Integral membrane protein [Lasiodiplodia theobromae]KAF4546679.1 Integral membrane protein [Lasiodiplodia theobromae]
MTTGHDAVVACFVCAAVAAVFVGLRIYTRFCISRHPGWDDSMVVIALLFAIILCPIYVQQLKYGLGEHIDEIPPQKLGNQMHWFWVSTWIYLTGVAFAKISILVQYIRVFVGRKTVMASWATVAFIVTCCLVCFFGGVFACTPVEKFWNPTVPGKCIDYLAIWYLHCSMAIATDLAIVIIPLPTIFNMNLESKKKWSLAFTFALGGFGCVTSIIRLYYLYFLTHTRDVTHYNPIPAMWSAVELAVVIVCACLITLHPLLVRALSPLRRFASSYTGSAERAAQHQQEIPSYAKNTVGGGPLPSPSSKVRFSRAMTGWEGNGNGRNGGNVIVGLGTMLLEGWSDERLAPLPEDVSGGGRKRESAGVIKVETTVDVATDSGSLLTTRGRSDDGGDSLKSGDGGPEAGEGMGGSGKWVDVELGKMV